LGIGIAIYGDPTRALLECDIQLAKPTGSDVGRTCRWRGGAILSRAIRIRDLGRLVELKGAWKTLIPQMILGATLAMIVVLILRTGTIKIESFDFEAADATTLFVVGLVSGFSEPFALGILERW
jgi:hypothetical protein